MLAGSRSLSRIITFEFPIEKSRKESVNQFQKFLITKKPNNTTVKSLSKGIINVALPLRNEIIKPFMIAF
jgi:hypothetical protein